MIKKVCIASVVVSVSLLVHLLIPIAIASPTSIPVKTYAVGDQRIVKAFTAALEEEVKVIPVFEIDRFNNLIREEIIGPDSLVIIDSGWWYENLESVSRLVDLTLERKATITVIGEGPQVLLRLPEVTRLPKISIVEEVEAYRIDTRREVQERIEAVPLIALGIRVGEIAFEEEPPSVSTLTVYGDEIPYAVVKAYRWGVRTIKSSYRRERSTSNPNWEPPMWEWDWSYSDKPYGVMNFWGGWRYLSGDGNSQYKWYVVDFKVETVPGKVKGWSTWYWSQHQTTRATLTADLDNERSPSGYYYDRGPTSTVGIITVGYDIGVQAGKGGAVVSLSASRSTSIPERRVRDLSDHSIQLVGWQEEFKWNSTSATGTFLFEPGVNMRADQGEIPWARIKLKWKWEDWAYWIQYTVKGWI